MRHSPRSRALLLLVVALGACGAPAVPLASTDGPGAFEPLASGGTTTLNVFAAASLTEAFQEIGRRFEVANPHVAVAFNFAGSNQLAQQIGQGAPADVFASANTQQMNAVVASGQVVDGTARAFAGNRLVVIYPRDNPARLQALNDLARPGVKLVLAAKAVPVGGYALDFLAKAAQLPEYTAAYSVTVLANVVSYEQNVKAVLAKVVLGEADAGIVYSSDVALDSVDQIGTIDIPDPLNTLASYPIAPINDSAHAELAKTFIAYVLSGEGQATLARYGFMTVQE